MMRIVVRYGFFFALVLNACARPYVGRCFLGACSSADPSTAGTIPTSASSLNVTTVSSSAVDLTWSDDSSDETGFIIERKAGAGAWSEIATVSAGSTSYSDTGLDPLTAYSYRITAKGSGGNSSATSASVAVTYFDNTGSWTDNFSTLDTTFWTGNADMSIVANKLHVIHTANTNAEGIVSKFYLDGDFDVQVSFSNLNFPLCNYSAIGLMVTADNGGGTSFYNIERRMNGGLERMFTDNGATASSIDASASGTFRMVRSGANWTVYQSDGTTVLSTVVGATGLAYVGLYGRDDWNGCTATGDFDDLVIQ